MITPTELRLPLWLRVKWLQEKVEVTQELLPQPVWGQLGYSYVNGVVHLLWSGTGMFQLQIGYMYPDGIHWFNEGSCRQGPADIELSPRDEGSEQYFRIVECGE